MGVNLWFLTKKKIDIYLIVRVFSYVIIIKLFKRYEKIFNSLYL